MTKGSMTPISQDLQCSTPGKIRKELHYHGSSDTPIGMSLKIEVLHTNTVGNLTENLVVPQHCLITKITEGGVAWEMGLRLNDELLIAGGQPLLSQLMKRAFNVPTGQTVQQWKQPGSAYHTWLVSILNQAQNRLSMALDRGGSVIIERKGLNETLSKADLDKHTVNLCGVGERAYRSGRSEHDAISIEED
jgi:hypothetical protein